LKNSQEERKKCVLVVDDEPGILRFISTSLKLAGYDVITNTNGEEALHIAQSQKPDILLLDILMHPLTGFDVLERLRTFSQIPVIVFTARKEIVDMALKEGANDYIAKPFIPDDLIKKIKEVLKNPTVSGDQGTMANE
jgi:DNA-binding response OmpR family regulator